MLAPGTLIADKYRLEALLGEGGMGAVYRARHELMQKPVALKWLKSGLSDEAGARERFMQEARAAARIRHPNVVDVYDIGVHEGGLFMVMELLEGASFAELLEQAELPLGTAIDHLLGAMRGVAAAHAAGITHRDIKPENIFIAHDAHVDHGVANVLDFGISKLHDAPLTHLTQPGAALGTPHYMSFEQMQGARDLDHRTDIYSFGVLLYRVLTGVLPFDGATFTAIVVSCAGARPPSPRRLRPTIPQELDDLVMKAIALRPSDRFATMDELIRALSAVRASPKFQARLAHERVPPPARAPDSDSLVHAPDVSTHAARAGSGRRSLPASTTGAGSALTDADTRAKRVRRILGASACVLALGLVVAAYVLTRADKSTVPTARSTPAPLPAPTAADKPVELEVGRSTGIAAPLPAREDGRASAPDTRPDAAVPPQPLSSPTAAPPPRVRPAIDPSRVAPDGQPRRRSGPLPAAVPTASLKTNQQRSAPATEPATNTPATNTPATNTPATATPPPATATPSEKKQTEHSHRSGHLGREDL